MKVVKQLTCVLLLVALCAGVIFGLMVLDEGKHKRDRAELEQLRAKLEEKQESVAGAFIALRSSEESAAVADAMRLLAYYKPLLARYREVFNYYRDRHSDVAKGFPDPRDFISPEEYLPQRKG